MCALSAHHAQIWLNTRMRPYEECPQACQGCLRGVQRRKIICQSLAPAVLPALAVQVAGMESDPRRVPHLGPESAAAGAAVGVAILVATWLAISLCFERMYS